MPTSDRYGQYSQDRPVTTVTDPHAQYTQDSPKFSAPQTDYSWTAPGARPVATPQHFSTGAGPRGGVGGGGGGYDGGGGGGSGGGGEPLELKSYSLPPEERGKDDGDGKGGGDEDSPSPLSPKPVPGYSAQSGSGRDFNDGDTGGGMAGSVGGQPVGAGWASAWEGP